MPITLQNQCRFKTNADPWLLLSVADSASGLDGTPVEME